MRSEWKWKPARSRSIRPIKRIQEYVQEKYGFKVHTAYIAEVKRMVGLDMHKAPNAVEQRKHEYHPCPPEKVEAIKDALRHFGLTSE